MRSTIITGVSRGLGEALFSEMAASGGRVLAIGRRFTPDQHHQASAEPDRIRLHLADLADPAGLAAGDLAGPLGEAMREASSVVLINNAAVIEPIGTVGTLPTADLAVSVSVNLLAPMALTNALLAVRPSRLPTTLVYVSSAAATVASPALSAYCAGKAGAEAFFRVVAAEHPDVRVACVNPGRLDTAMQAQLRGPAYPYATERIELHRRGELGDPAEVARSIIETHLTDG